MVALRDPRQSSTRLALSAGGEDHHFAPRQVHGHGEIDRFGQVLQVAARLSCSDDPVERAPGDAPPPPGCLRDIAQRLQTRNVRGKGGDEDAAPLVSPNFLQQPAMQEFND